MNYLEEFKKVLDNTGFSFYNSEKTDMEVFFIRLIACLFQVKQYKKKIMLIGNGASMSMASHFAVDFKKNGKFNTEFTDSGALLSCYSNDYGQDNMFMEMVKQRLDMGDLLIAISSSGNSENIFQACLEAKLSKIWIITLTGFSSDNRIKKLGDFNIHIPDLTYGKVESAHSFWLHYILDEFIKEENR